MVVRMELHRIIIVDKYDQQLIQLREVDGSRELPIMIGTAEAKAIDRRLKGIAAQRPMTHDLLGQVIEQLGGTLDRIEITNLQDATFFAALHIAREGNVVVVDCRPSDAIALGIATNVPIFVAEHVLQQVG